MEVDIAEDVLVSEEILPVDGAVVPVEVVRGDADLLLDAEVLVAHVLDLDGDIAPRPLEREGGWVAEVVDGVDVIGDGLELLLAGLELGEGAGTEEVGVFG